MSVHHDRRQVRLITWKNCTISQQQQQLPIPHQHNYFLQELGQDQIINSTSYIYLSSYPNKRCLNDKIEFSTAFCSASIYLASYLSLQA